MITRNFNLYLNAGHSVPLVINVNQYDSGEQWIFTLHNSDGTQYTPSTGAIVGIKSDGLGIINSGSVVDGKVVINETQQMTAAVGKAVFELLIDSQTHGTANFVVLVEKRPGDNADMSESDLSLLQEAIDSTSETHIFAAVQEWMDENLDTSSVVDKTLTISGAAADAKVTGDALATKITMPSGGVAQQVLAKTANGVEWTDKAGQVYLLQHDIDSSGTRKVTLERYLASEDTPEQAGIIQIVNTVSEGNTQAVQSGAVYTAVESVRALANTAWNTAKEKASITVNQDGTLAVNYAPLQLVDVPTMAHIGDFSDLDTSANWTLVAAINETFNRTRDYITSSEIAEVLEG